MEKSIEKARSVRAKFEKYLANRSDEIWIGLRWDDTNGYKIQLTFESDQALKREAIPERVDGVKIETRIGE